jgi:hypothetical protein
MPIQIEQKVQWTGRAHLLMFYLEVFQGFLIQQETKLCGLEVHQRQSIYSSEYAKQCGFTNLRRDEIPSYQRYDIEERLYACSTFLHLSRLQTFKLGDELLPS